MAGPYRERLAGDDQEPALQMQKICKRFGHVIALDEVSFTARTGTVHALVGENGAGKSTLMKVLSGVHRPDKGTIHVDGRARRWSRPSQALDEGLAMIYQELSLAPELTVAENVFLGIEPRGVLPGIVKPRAMVDRTAALAMEHGFQLEPTAKVEQLTAAECQIVEILKALARRASIIVMDEPTSSLGRDEAMALLSVVRDLRERGSTIIYISHRLEEVVDLADDVTVLRDGRAVHSGPMAELDIPTIVRHMVGRELNEYYPSRRVAIGDVRLSVKKLSSRAGIADISFDVRSGEVVGVAGLVGAGRTDLARILFGVERLTSGSITFDGRPVALNGPDDALKLGFMLLTEDRKRTGLCLELSSAWNITLPCLTKLGMSRWLDLRRERELVAEVGERLSLKWSSQDAPASSLSGGNQQKLLFARALLADSQLVVLDEPTRGIDIAAKADIYKLLNELVAAGKAVLFISSELPELFGVTDRLLVMRRGRLVADLVTKDTTQEEVMQLAAVDTKEAS